jgi:hypothetical protein
MTRLDDGLWLRVSARTSACLHRHGAFVRVCGWGLGIADHRVTPPLFSERYSGRYGVARRHFWHIGPWCIRTLHPLGGSWPHPPVTPSAPSGEPHRESA